MLASECLNMSFRLSPQDWMIRSMLLSLSEVKKSSEDKAKQDKTKHFWFILVPSLFFCRSPGPLQKSPKALSRPWRHEATATKATKAPVRITVPWR